jgi:hypothetical protein
MSVLGPTRFRKMAIQPQTLDLQTRHLQVKVLNQNGSVILQFAASL